jgi:lipid A 4'-phosphatase
MTHYEHLIRAGLVKRLLSNPGGFCRRRNTSVNRIALIVVVVITVVSGFAFALYPAIDLSIARAAYEATNPGNGTVAHLLLQTATILRKAAVWIEVLFIVPAIVALVVKLLLPRTRMFISGRAIIFLVTSLIVGPGLIVNAMLKDHWERPKPGHLVQFGGNQHFVPWWQPIGDCRRNCSFVSGEASAAFWTIAPAALAPPQWKPLAYAAAIGFGTIVSLSRIVTGGHFLSDTVFAGLFTFVVIWILYAIIYRWRRTQLDDNAIETAIERMSPRWAFLSSLRKRAARTHRERRRTF